MEMTERIVKREGISGALAEEGAQAAGLAPPRSEPESGTRSVGLGAGVLPGDLQGFSAWFSNCALKAASEARVSAPATETGPLPYMFLNIFLFLAI